MKLTHFLLIIRWKQFLYTINRIDAFSYNRIDVFSYNLGLTHFHTIGLTHFLTIGLMHCLTIELKHFLTIGLTLFLYTNWDWSWCNLLMKRYALFFIFALFFLFVIIVLHNNKIFSYDIFFSGRKTPYPLFSIS